MNLHEAERARIKRFFDRSLPAFTIIERVVRPEYRDVVGRLDLRATRTVLDIGTGTGSLAQVLVDAGCSVTGVDFSERLLSRARRRVPSARFLAMDLANLDELGDNSYDLVTFAYVLHGLPEDLRMHALRHARRIGRRVLIIDYRRRGNWFTRLIEWFEGPHYNQYLRFPLRESLELAGLSIVERARTTTGGGYWLCVDSSPPRASFGQKRR